MCKRYGPSWRNRKVLLFSDNYQVVSLINKGVSNNGYCMKIMRKVFWESVKFNFHIVARHLPGGRNIIPDYLSRIRVHNEIFRYSYLMCCAAGFDDGYVHLQMS